MDHLETAFETSTGVARIVDSGVRAPMEFTNAVARGFHNMPKLYGDDTVRSSDHITDFKSGLKAAGKGTDSMACKYHTSSRARESSDFLPAHS